MTKKWLWLTIGAVAVVGFVAGMVVAQEEEWDLDFLPAYYSESYTPTLVEWRKVQFNAFETREAFLTDRLRQTNCVLYLDEWGINLTVRTSTEPDWDMYLGDRDWACSEEEVKTTYAEAAEEIVDSVRNYFPEIADEDLHVVFYIEGSSWPVAVWEDGETFVGNEALLYLDW